jgi:hypothetical protein
VYDIQMLWCFQDQLSWKIIYVNQKQYLLIHHIKVSCLQKLLWARGADEKGRGRSGMRGRKGKPKAEVI